jgi:hypothetical protein
LLAGTRVGAAKKKWAVKPIAIKQACTRQVVARAVRRSSLPWMSLQKAASLRAEHAGYPADPFKLRA